MLHCSSVLLAAINTFLLDSASIPGLYPVYFKNSSLTCLLTWSLLTLSVLTIVLYVICSSLWVVTFTINKIINQHFESVHTLFTRIYSKNKNEKWYILHGSIALHVCWRVYFQWFHVTQPELVNLEIWFYFLCGYIYCMLICHLPWLYSTSHLELFQAEPTQYFWNLHWDGLISIDFMIVLICALSQNIFRSSSFLIGPVLTYVELIFA